MMNEEEINEELELKINFFKHPLDWLKAKYIYAKEYIHTWKLMSLAYDLRALDESDAWLVLISVDYEDLELAMQWKKLTAISSGNMQNDLESPRYIKRQERAKRERIAQKKKEKAEVDKLGSEFA